MFVWEGGREEMKGYVHRLTPMIMKVAKSQVYKVAQ